MEVVFQTERYVFSLVKMAHYFNQIRHTLRHHDFKFPKDAKCCSYDITTYYGSASAFDTLYKIIPQMTHPIRVIRSDLRVSGVSSVSTAKTSIYHCHYVALGKNGKIVIVDPRSIFTHRYDKNVFSTVPPIFEGNLDDLRSFSSYTDLVPDDFWAKKCIKEYVNKILFGVEQNIKTGRSDPISLYHWSDESL